MYTVALVLACLGCTAYAHRVHSIERAQGTGSKDSLASFLLATNPAASVPRSRPVRAGRTNMAIAPLGESRGAPKMADWAGVTAPLGFFDPVGFTKDISEGRQRFYREVELKHARVAMLAALGFPLAEKFHPLFGGDIDVPSIFAFQETLQMGLRQEPNIIYGLILLAIAIPEVFSVFTFNSPAGGEPWSIREDHEPGNLGFDPLGLKPRDEAELKEMQTKELNNGRLAMLGAAGMIAQELVEPYGIVDKIFEPSGPSL